MSTGVRWGSATHQGRVRDHNEDSLLAGPRVFAVADGMGGHAGGEVASSLAIATLAGAVDDQPDVPGVEAALAMCNAAIRQRGRRQGLQEMGSTITGVAQAQGDRFVVFNLGDSRVYRFRANALEQLTDDDSLVAELVRDGTLTEAEARSRPDRNVVTKALGVGDSIEPQVFEIDAREEDVFVISSDGLFNDVTSTEISAVCAEPASEDVRARMLVDVALEKGGSDNVSVVIVTVTSEAAADDLTQDTNPAPPVRQPSSESS